MKIRFGLITFYQCLNVVKEGLPCFTVFRTVKKEMIYRFNVTSTNTNGTYCVIKTMLMFTEMPLVNSFIPYGLQISKILLGKALVNSKSSLLKVLILSEFLIFSEFIPLNYWRGKKRVAKIIMLDFK